eukprot:Gregarina_sp_Poly_1__3486@NODE_2011_length_2868_cov_23_208854_g1276_i1_p1_GENE_NODE_2011_length_2868_cov_23_208854_g1276_i1NODE_2011_length_2868_cov_23_208854_g1276_i1_p1_ORF_typecomplete_len100_score5_97_NODE_2011_length_2868_cov_23_208854_g1276_i125562855
MYHAASTVSYSEKNLFPPISGFTVASAHVCIGWFRFNELAEIRVKIVYDRINKEGSAHVSSDVKLSTDGGIAVNSVVQKPNPPISIRPVPTAASNLAPL